MGHKSTRHLSLSDRMRAHLRVVHPTKTAEQVAAATRGQVSAAAYRRAEQRGGGFSGEAVLALVAAYGPDLLAAALPGLSWLSDASRRARQQQLIAAHARLAEEILRLTDAEHP